jgi:hypothetical protein
MFGKFDLISSVSELKETNDGVSESQFLQVTSLADITGTSFTRSNIVFNFETNGNQWIDLSESFFRIRMTLSTARNTVANNQLLYSDGLAPAMNMGGGLFNMIQCEINDRVVSRIDNFVPQTDALMCRMSRTKSDIESNIGAPLWHPEFGVRQSIVCDNRPIDGAADIRHKHGKTYKLQDTITLAGLGTSGDATFTIAAPTAGPPAFTTVTITSADAANRSASSIGSRFKVGDVVELSGLTAQVGVCRGTVLSVGLPAGAAGTGALVAIIIRAAMAENLGAAVAVNVLPAGAFINIYRPFDNTQDFGNAGGEAFEFLWQPPLSIFQVPHAMPSNLRYRITLTPNQNYQVACVENRSLNALVPQPPDANNYVTGYKLIMDQMNLYVRTYRHTSTDNLRFILDLTSYNCQSELISGNALSQKNFDVAASTTHLIVAYQSSLAGSDNSLPPTKLLMNPINDAYNLDLTRFYLTYAGVAYPQPDGDSSFFNDSNVLANTNTNTGISIDYTTWPYLQGLISSGSYRDSGGWESYANWKSKGPCSIFKTSKDERSQSTRVVVNNSFANNQPNRNLLLFNVFKQVCEISIENAKVSSVQLTDR